MWHSRYDFYSDDPVETASSPTKKTFSSFLAFIVLLVGGTYLVQTTLAANIAINTGASVEFGQGIRTTTACSGTTPLILTPNSSFVNISGGGDYYLSSVKVANIPSSCYGADFTINAYGASGNSPLAIFNSTSSNAVVYNNAGTFELGVGTTSGASISSGSGTFTITFTSPVATSGSVSRVTLQSGPHVQNTYGVSWTSRSSAADSNWNSVTYGNGIFVAVANSGAGSRVMTSSDGITWTGRTSATSNSWNGVAYGNGTFVAIASDGTGNGVMTSPDGITWTSRTSPADNGWFGITYGNGLFVAVSWNGTGNRVMTSPDGITWTARASAADLEWIGITYGNGLFVAVAGSGTGNRVMTSTDGINWTLRNSAADNSWNSVTFGNGTFVAVSFSGSGDRVMTSN